MDLSKVYDFDDRINVPSDWVGYVRDTAISKCQQVQHRLGPMLNAYDTVCPHCSPDALALCLLPLPFESVITSNNA